MSAAAAGEYDGHRAGQFFQGGPPGLGQAGVAGQGQHQAGGAVEQLGARERARHRRGERGRAARG